VLLPSPVPQLLAELGRKSTWRVAIGNRRILEFDRQAGMVTFGYRKNNAGPHGEDIDDTMRLDAVEFIRRYLLHVMPKWFSRSRFYGWWSSPRKGKELPRIRAALGMPPQNDTDPEAEETQEDMPDPALPDDMEKVLRVQCPRCHAQTLERVLQVPRPSVYDLLQIVIWPQQRKNPIETQAVLPDMETWLPRGDAFMASLYAQSHDEPTSGFT